MTSPRIRYEKIRVIGRFRPSNKSEKEEWNANKNNKYSQSKKEIVCSASGPTVKIENPQSGSPYRYTFDELLWIDSNQENVFQSIAGPVCRNALNGFNGTVIAFGQTGTGKTYSIVGPERNYGADESGIVPRAASFFFHAIENSPDVESAELRVSFLEIYKQQLRDLNPSSSKALQLKTRQKMNGETYIENLNDMAVTSLNQMLKLVNIANSNRTKMASSINQSSFRSHLIITFSLKLRKSIESGGHKLTSKVTFIDLAGSEKKGKKSGMSSVNPDITTLERVVECLVKRRKSVPFNDSVLTTILKDSINGNSITTIMLNCSPHISCLNDTVLTCQFGQKCKLLKTRITSNKELTPQQMKGLIKRLQKENMSKQQSMNDENKLLEYQKRINELTLDLEDERKNYNDLMNKLESKEEKDAMHENQKNEIQNLKMENENLISELNQINLERRDLAIMNVLLVDRLNNEDNDDNEEKDYPNQHIIEKLADMDVNYLNSDKVNIMQELEECEFNTEECQKMYENILKQIQSLGKELKHSNKKISKLEDQNENYEKEIEITKAEIETLKKNIDNDGGNKKKDKKKKKKNKDDEKYDEENEYGNIDINDQEDYLQNLAETEQEVWDEREEKAWREYLTQRAQKEGFKKGKELLKQRRADAKQRIKNGELDEMPTDEELLEDIRDDFYRLYDVSTGSLKNEREYQQELNQIYGNVNNNLDIDLEEINDEVDENAIDDPFEWNEDEVIEWLSTINLKKYSKPFKTESVDGRVLLVDLNKNNLKRDLTVKSVHVDKLMRSIMELRNRSPGYDNWKKLQGIEDEPKQPVNKVNKINVDDEMDVDKNNDYDDYDIDMNKNDMNENWELTEEEKQFGEQFWALDELFNILDIYKTGKLNRTAFKHGLHALQVALNDDEMDRVFEQIDQENKGEINYKQFIQYLQFTDFLPSQSQKYAQDILAALPRVAANRKQYVTRAAMVIKYAVRYNNTRSEINNYLLNKGLTRAEIDAAWKQYRFNSKAIRDIDFKSLIGKKGKLIDMAVQDPENVLPFNDYFLYKLLKRAGSKAGNNQSNEFNDLDYLRASGSNSRIASIKCWYEPVSQFFNGLQVTYECTNGQTIKGGKNMIRQGQYVEGTMNFKRDEVLLVVTVYFAHFVCGVRFETDRGNKLFGSDYGCSSVVLSAPVGTSIMAFYGSIGRLVETLGVYCCVNPNMNINNQNKRPMSGVKAVNLKKSKSKKSINNKLPENNNEEGEYNNTTTNPKKNKKKKKGKKFQDEDDEEY